MQEIDSTCICVVCKQTGNNWLRLEFFICIFRIRRHPASDLQHFQTGNSDRNHWHIARDLNRLHYESQSVRRRALSDIFRVGSVGDSGHCVGGWTVHCLYAPAAGSLRHYLDTVRGIFDQRNAYRLFPGRIYIQEYSS